MLDVDRTARLARAIVRRDAVRALLALVPLLAVAAAATYVHRPARTAAPAAGFAVAAAARDELVPALRSGVASTTRRAATGSRAR